MNWHSPRFLISLLIICMILIVGIGVAVVYLRSNTSANITIIWQAHSTAFTPQDQQDIQTAWKSELMAAHPGGVAGHEFTIIDVQRQGEWAALSANERIGHDTPPLAGEPLFFLARRQSATWSVWLPSSPSFCDHLKQAPDTLLDATDKGYFC